MNRPDGLNTTSAGVLPLPNGEVGSLFSRPVWAFTENTDTRARSTFVAIANRPDGLNATSFQLERLRNGEPDTRVRRPVAEFTENTDTPLALARASSRPDRLNVGVEDRSGVRNGEPDTRVRRPLAEFTENIHTWFPVMPEEAARSRPEGLNAAVGPEPAANGDPATSLSTAAASADGATGRPTTNAVAAHKPHTLALRARPNTFDPFTKLALDTKPPCSR
jgi:hypothetical protein